MQKKTVRQYKDKILRACYFHRVCSFRVALRWNRWGLIGDWRFGRGILQEQGIYGFVRVSERLSNIFENISILGLLICTEWNFQKKITQQDFDILSVVSSLLTTTYDKVSAGVLKSLPKCCQHSAGQVANSNICYLLPSESSLP